MPLRAVQGFKFCPMENISGKPTAPNFTTYEKTAIALLALTQFSVVLDFMVLSPLGDILMKSLEIGPAQFGFAVSAYAFSAGIAGLLAAGFADKYDRKKLLLFFYSGFLLGTFFCGIAQSYHALLAARIVTGLFGGVIGSISMAIITDIFPLEKRGRVMGTVQMGFAASQVLGIPIGLFLANKWDWHAPFLMIVGLGLATVLGIFRFLKPIADHLKETAGQNAAAHLWHVASMPRYRVAFSATALLSIGGFLMMPFGSAFLVNNQGVLQSELPLIFMITGVSSLVIMPLVGRLADQFDKFLIFAVGSAWAAIWITVYCNFEMAPYWLIITVNILLFMGIMARMIPATAIMSAVPELPDRGAFMSIMASLQQIAGGIASSFAGLLIVQKDKFSPLENYPTLGYVASGTMVLCAWLLWRVWREVPKKK